jgi:hypothetical protein
LVPQLGAPASGQEPVQQTPPPQTLVVHWSFAVHDDPGATFATHVVPAQ